MSFILLPATNDHRMVIENLVQFYIYDFSEYVNCDVEANGLFAPYPGLNDYWQQDDKFPYIIMQEEKYIGFVLVKFIQAAERSYFSIAEFFIMKKYRQQGIGKAVAMQVFNLHRGQWEVYQRETNKPAQLFWHKVISAYTKDKFKERFENGKRIQDFEN